MAVAAPRPATSKSASSSTPQQVSFTSKLMQNYRLATPVSAGSQIATALNGSGQAELFSIGTNGHVYNVYPDSTSDTGWSILDLDFPAQAKAIAAAANTDGSTTVYAAGTNNTLYAIGSQRWGAGWQPMPSVSLAQSTIQGVNVGYDEQAVPFVILMTISTDPQDGKTGYQPWILLNGQWTRIGRPVIPQVVDWCAARVADVDINETDSATCPGAYLAGATSWSASWYRALGGYAYTGSDYFWSGRWIAGNYGAVSAALDVQGNSEPFGLSLDDHGIYYLYPDPTSQNKRFAAAKISGDIAVSALAAGSTGSGTLEVFALSTGGHLYHIRQDSSVSGGWSTFVPLVENLTFTQLVAGKNPAGYTDLFAVTTANDLYHVWQDPVTTDWHIDEIELAARGDLEEYRSYNVQMTTYDQAGANAPNAQVRIFSDDPVTIEINGASVFLDATHSWQGTSNNAGCVTIGWKIGALGLTPLTVWTSSMPETDRIAVDPSGPIHQQLSGLDGAGDQLLAAQVTVGRSGQQVPLLQGNANRDPSVVAAISQAVKQAMSLAVTQPAAGAPDADGAAAAAVFHRKNDPLVARYLADYDGSNPGRIHLPSVPDQHWQVEFSTGKPVFRTLTADEAAGLLAQRATQPTAASFFGWDVDWGDVFDVVEQGIATVSDFVVTTVSDGIQAAITLVAESVQFVFNATIEVVEQTFDLVEEIFDKVAVGFEQLFGWLGFIFDWDDILRTHEAARFALDQMFVFQKVALVGLKPTIDNFFGGLEQQVTRAFQSAIGGVLGQDSLAAIQASPPAQPPPNSEILDHNVVLNSLVNNLGATTPPSTATVAASPELMEASENLVTLLNQQAGTFEASDAFSQALTYFEAAFANPDQFFANTLAGLLSTAEGLSLWALQAADSIVDTVIDAIVAVLDAIHDLLFATWDIPLISDLYAWLTATSSNPNGSPLSAADLVTLLIAVPATVVYKLTFGEAPFPTTVSVTQFQNTYTANYLLSQAGFTPPSNGATPSAVATVGTAATVPAGLQKTWNILYSFNLCAYGILETIVDAADTGKSTEADAEDPLDAAASFAALAAEYLGQVFSIPVLAGNATMIPSCRAGDGFDALVWYIQWLEVGIDTCFYRFEKKITRICGDAGAIVIGLWGFAHGGLLLGSAFSNPDGVDGLEVSESFLTFLPELAKFARIKSVEKGTSYASIPALLAVDVLGNFGAGFVHFLRTVRSSDAPAIVAQTAIAAG